MCLFFLSLRQEVKGDSVTTFCQACVGRATLSNIYMNIENSFPLLLLTPNPRDFLHKSLQPFFSVHISIMCHTSRLPHSVTFSTTSIWQQSQHSFRGFLSFPLKLDGKHANMTAPRRTCWPNSLQKQHMHHRRDVKVSASRLVCRS